MALNENRAMVTRHNQQNYLLLNDGYDETLPEDQITESNFESFVNLSSTEVLPSESVSQALTHSAPIVSSSILPRKRPAPTTAWMWDYFQTTEVAREWIRCAFINEKTGIQCPWTTSDSLRQTSTSNMQQHHKKHSIYSPHSQDEPLPKKQASVISLLTRKETLSHQQLLERNILQWVIHDKQAFTTIE
ncbi:hypothetical protein P152DRAFT_369984, partial [Eremomyces bilateralis CBS 781.70]